MGLLEHVKSPRDVKCMTMDELETLAGEIRGRIIEVVKKNGGHLSSNLGTVDIIVALYYVFDFPEDKLIFDVGHQSYAHKILSGRNVDFDTLRKSGGLSGFPNIFESVFDAFNAGHAGNSLSASLGYCAARDALGENYNVINLVGDASFFNGEYLEALSSGNKKPEKLIVILNDNGMSISPNNNALYKFFSSISTKKSYSRLMFAADKTIGNTFVGTLLKRFKRFVKFNMNKTSIVEALGFKYVGIFDGHNIKQLVRILTNLKNGGKSTLLHLKTRKGKGMTEAETRAGYYHGVGKNFATGTNVFSETAGEYLERLAEKDEKVVAVCAGMKDGTGLNDFAKNHPDRFFDVGIAEEHAVTFAAGLAKGGLRPVVCIYSTFLQRSYDQIMQDVCCQKLPVVFFVDRAGAVGADGITHQGLFDLTYLRSLPNMSVFAPKDREEFKNVADYAFSLSTPCALRYPNGGAEEDESHLPIEESLWEGKVGGENVILAVGPCALKIARDIEKSSDRSISVVNARSVKPLDDKILLRIRDKNILTIEENVISGGFGSAVAEFYATKGLKVNLRIFAFPDAYVPHGTKAEQLSAAGLTAENILPYLI